MKINSKNLITLISIILIYILLAGVGVYSPIGIILFPILSVPLAVCLIKETFPSGIDFLFNITVIIGIYFITQSIEAVLVYTIVVCVPAYTISFSYKKGISVPQTIMYATVISVISIFIYIGIMKYFGADYAKVFLSVVDDMKGMYFNALETLKTSIPTEGLAQIGELKGIISAILDTMKLVYPALLMMFILALTTIEILILNLVLKIKKVKKPSLKQLLNFKLSTAVVFILFIAMLVTWNITDLNNIWLIVALNIVVFLQNLLQIVGLISAIVLISRRMTGSGVKVVLYILVVLLFMIYSGVFVMFGCLDTIFNYRKAEIIV